MNIPTWLAVLAFIAFTLFVLFGLRDVFDLWIQLKDSADDEDLT